MSGPAGGSRRPPVSLYYPAWRPLITYLPLVILALVLLLIAVRRIGGMRLGIWQIMLGGAIAVILTGGITPEDAARAINPEVMIFLFGVFILGESLSGSGALLPAAERLLSRPMSMDAVVIALILAAGVSSAVLMNDTVAVIGTPFVIAFARRFDLPPSMLLLALAFALTTGSVASPIGNPQNLLIATETGMADPFLTFAAHLFVPTVLSLVLVYAVIRLRYPAEFSRCILPAGDGMPPDRTGTRVALLGLGCLLGMVGLKIAAGLAGSGITVSLTAIALAGAFPVVLFAPNRKQILRSIDWRTLVFFAALFVLMQSVWDTGTLQAALGGGVGAALPPSSILVVAVIASQIISNVPLVALGLPLAGGAGASAPSLMALAAGSTIAGNLLILGAASNVIIIQNAEKHGESIGFLDFARAGVPLTLCQIAVFGVFLAGG